MRSWMAWSALAVSAGLALAAFAYPMAVIQPFQYQDPERLALALQVRQWGPAASLLLAIVAMAGAALTRVNVFERMFAPVGDPRAEPAAEAKLDPGDMVLAVTVGGAARAYGVRMLAYHHIVNDWLGGGSAGGRVLNAVSHRSGVEAANRWAGTDVPARGHQQSKLPDAR